jgi:hypothetical protein
VPINLPSSSEFKPLPDVSSSWKYDTNQPNTAHNGQVLQSFLNPKAQSRQQTGVDQFQMGNTANSTNNKPQPISNKSQGQGEDQRPSQGFMFGSSSTRHTDLASSVMQQDNCRINTDSPNLVTPRSSNESDLVRSCSSNFKQNLEGRFSASVQNLPKETKEWLTQVVSVADRWRQKLTADKKNSDNNSWRVNSSNSVHAWLTRMLLICQQRVESALQGSVQDQRGSWHCSWEQQSQASTPPGAEVYESLPLGVAIISLEQLFQPQTNNADSSLPLINAAMALLLDYPRDELARMYASLCGFAKIYHIDNLSGAIDQFCGAVMQGKSSFHLTSSLVDKSGRILPVVESIKLTYDRGLPAHVTIMYQLIQDIPSLPSSNNSQSSSQPMDDSKDEQSSSPSNSANQESLTRLSQQRTVSIERAVRAIEELQLQLEAVSKQKQESKNEKVPATQHPTVHYHSLHAPTHLHDTKAQQHLQQSQSSPTLRPFTTSNHVHQSGTLLALNNNNSLQNTLPWLKPLNEFMDLDSFTPLGPQRVFSEPPAPLTALPSIEVPLTDFVGSAANAPSLMDFMRSVHHGSKTSAASGHGRHQANSVRMMMDTENRPKNFSSENNHSTSLSLASVVGVRSTSGTLQGSSSVFD